jgi:hypothetical protein
LARELDRLLAPKATQTDGRRLQASMFVDARDKLLVFLTRRDVEPTNNVSDGGQAIARAAVGETKVRRKAAAPLPAP